MTDGGAPAPRPAADASAERGMDVYSDVLGMTPREHERRMRKWYVLLAIVCFLGVFGEGILLMVSRARRQGDASPAERRGAAVQPPLAGDTAVPR